MRPAGAPIPQPEPASPPPGGAFFLSLLPHPHPAPAGPPRAGGGAVCRCDRGDERRGPCEQHYRGGSRLVPASSRRAPQRGFPLPRSHAERADEFDHPKNSPQAASATSTPSCEPRPVPERQTTLSSLPRAVSEAGGNAVDRTQAAGGPPDHCHRRRSHLSWASRQPEWSAHRAEPRQRPQRRCLFPVLVSLPRQL